MSGVILNRLSFLHVVFKVRRSLDMGSLATMINLTNELKFRTNLHGAKHQITGCLLAECSGGRY